jgi:hypothetical protein
MVPICMFLAVMNVIYNNLFTNLRFKCKTCCKPCGLCIYDGIYWLAGFCCLKKVCQDKCFTWGTIVKWIVHGGIFGYAIWSVGMAKERMLPASGQLVTKLAGVGIKGIHIDVILYLHVLQHAIFLAARPILFIVWSILTCCCDKGQEFGENHSFDDTIISYEYIAYETQNRGGFEHIPNNPIAELSYQRNLSQVQKAAGAKAAEKAAELEGSLLRRASVRMTGALQNQLGLSQRGNVCPICTTGIEPGQTYVHLGCHPKHCVHDYCYDELNAFFKDNTACPLCR